MFLDSGAIYYRTKGVPEENKYILQFAYISKPIPKSSYFNLEAGDSMFLRNVYIRLRLLCVTKYKILSL
jgi:hypothetical protein